MNDQNQQKPTLHLLPLGTYQSETRDGKLVALKPFSEDPDPSPISNGYIDTLDDEQRIRQPMVGKSLPASCSPNMKTILWLINS